MLKWLLLFVFALLLPFLPDIVVWITAGACLACVIVQLSDRRC